MLSVLLHFLACSSAFVAPPDAVPRHSEAGLEATGEDTGVGGDSAAPAESETAGDTAGIEEDEPPETITPPPCDSYGSPEKTGVVADANLNEISGVAFSWRNPGVLWVMEDHAGANAVFAIDAAGNPLGQIVLDGVTNHDWEDLAVGPCGEASCLFVGDIGDNDHDRTEHAILRIEEPEVLLSGGLDLTVTPTSFPFLYPDGFWDSESLAITPEGVPVLFTKEYDTEMSTAYTFGALVPDEVAILERRGRFETGSSGEGGGAAATAADFWPDGSRLLLRTYGHVWEYTLTPGGLDEMSEAARQERFTGAEGQGEAIGYDSAGRAFTTLSEGLNPAVWRVGCED